ncbi:RluA family pseudouridine synthase [bacterium]|nr:RluA family pseudouridine synthase [bacterium]
MSFVEQFPVVIDEQSQGQRVDKFISQFIEGQSRSQVVDLIQGGKILVNSKSAKASYKLRSGDVLSVLEGFVKMAPEHYKELISYNGPSLDVLFEDDRLVVVNKPEGLVVHPGAGVGMSDTLASWLQFEKKISLTLGWPPELIEDGRVGLVHRLDKGTSGAILMAKDPATHQKLSDMFQNRNIHRIYWALVQGNLENRLSNRMSKLEGFLFKGWAALKRDSALCWSLATNHKRDPKNPLRYRADKEGKRAISNFICRSSREEDSFVELKLSTGRTHQIRAHMALLGCPVMGDTLYGAKEASRIFLHSRRVVFRHPWTNALIDLQASSRSFESFSKILGYRPQDYNDNSLISGQL